MAERAQLDSIALEVAERVRAEDLSLAVLGDLILDVTVEGDRGGEHPETGVSLLKNASSQESIGGAGNVALALSRLGVPMTVFSIVGADLPGRQLVETQARLPFKAHVVTYRGWPTPKKQWIYERGPEAACLVRRIDFDQPLPKEARGQLLGEFRARFAPGTRVLIVADHGLGALGAETAEAISLARAAGAKVVAIPRTPLEQYESVDVLVPNPTEMRELVGLAGKGEAQDAAVRFAREHGVTVFLTQGRQGLFVCCPAQDVAQLVSGKPVDHPQKMGARDMTLAIVALGMGLELPVLTIAELANAFAGLVVRQRGNGVVFWHDLFQSLGIPASRLPGAVSVPSK
ncbi:MAG: hypothetical protein HY000_41030 [Planctomycetes bacterium]|nr:hypothetical protein [Planctomycetota bacterium]